MLEQESQRRLDLKRTECGRGIAQSTNAIWRILEWEELCVSPLAAGLTPTESTAS